MPRFVPKNPDEIVYELKLELTLKEWKELQTQIHTNVHKVAPYPISLLHRSIDEMVTQAEKSFYSTGKE